MHNNTLPFINGGKHIEWAPDIPIWLSLLVIAASMLVAVVASLIRTRILIARGEMPAHAATEPAKKATTKKPTTRKK